MYNGVGYIIPIISFSLLYNLVKFFEIETIYIEGEVWVYWQYAYFFKLIYRIFFLFINIFIFGFLSRPIRVAHAPSFVSNLG
jgi:hypothetical protein